MLRILTAGVVTLLFSAGTVAAADPPRQTEPITVMPRLVDNGKVSGESKDPLKSTDAVILSAEEYRKLLDTIEQLRKQINPDKPEIPSVCRLSGKVETREQQDVVKVQAVYEFRTATPRAIINLGCRKAGATAATLDDGHLPLLQGSDDGYTVVIETPGTHKLVLELEVSLTTRGTSGNERGFTLHLPGSPITLIDRFEFPTGVARIRLGRLTSATPASSPVQNLPAQAFQPAVAGQSALVLGQVQGVELFWDNPAPQKPADPLPVADTTVTVRLDETTVTTMGRITLKTLRGRMSEWKVQVPANATLSVESSDPETSPTITRSQDDKNTWLVRVHDPVESEVVLLIELQSPRKGPVPVGPIAVPGAFRHQGTINIVAPSQLRPMASRLRADVSRREVTGEDSNAPDLQYAFGDRPLTPAAQNTPWLFVDAETLRGEVRTQTTHTLTLAEGGWRIVTEIRAAPLRTEIDHLDLDIPTELQELQAGPPALVAGLEQAPAGGPQRWQLKLVRSRRTEFSCKIEGFYAGLAGANQMTLQLPRPVQTQDRDGRVNVSVPEGLEVRGQVHEWDRDRVGEWGRPLAANSGNAAANAGATTSRTVAQVDLTWMPVQVQWPVQSVVDVTLDERQARIRQRLTFPPASGARSMVLRPMSSLAPVAFRVTEGATLTSSGAEIVLAVPPETGREQSIALSYAVPLRFRDQPSVSRVLDVGLLWPVSATRCETQVRFWSRPAAVSFQPKLAGGPWEVLPVEAVTGQDSLPQLVLQGSGTALPLTLQWSEWSGLLPAPAVAERVLVQVVLNDNGSQSYRARFWLQKVTAPFLELELPGEPSAIHLEAWLNGSRLDALPVMNDGNSPAKGSIVRVPLQEISDQVLELRYQLLSGASGNSSWSAKLTAPLLRGSVSVGAMRWQVVWAQDLAFLVEDSSVRTESIWSFRRGLPERRPAFTTAQLENWFRNGTELDSTGDEGETPYGTTWDGRSMNPAAFRLWLIPRTAWLLICSVTVLVLGLLLALLRRAPALFWPAIAILLLALGTWSLIATESALTFLAASPPGWLVLALALGVLWWLQRRYQRKVVFLPGFSRSEPSSARAQIGNNSHRRTEPSTAEARPAS
ncbi:MAG TPA: hypothetical protein VGZ47_00010 [Gemmataceae bacterium]|jgi:hypothetical protein|nr:hypothetical protein [Gemmataceae bacterium]